MPRSTLNTLNLLEEATHLLRRSPLSAWLYYYLGSLPFVAYLFYFWSDMSRSALARSHALESSLVLALLYWWMKVWQSIYSGRLLGIVEGKTETAPMPKRGWLRLITSQAWIHGTMPWVLTLASIAVLPFGWAYAFYHNITTLADEHYREGGRTKQLIDRALTQSHYKPMQNHSLLAMLTITTILVYLNLGLLFYLGATLFKSFTGMENDFSRQPLLIISTPMQTLFISGTYLIMGPFVKALYVLRCFYGQARKSGADLQVQLRQLQPNGTTLITAVLAFTLLMLAPLAAAEATATAPRETQSAVELDNSIKDVLAGSEFQWRFPRDGAALAEEDSWIGRQIKSFIAWVKSGVDSLAEFTARIIRWLTGGPEGMVAVGGAGGGGIVAFLPHILIGLLLVLFGILAVMIYQNWKLSKKDEPGAAETTAAADINLENENILATQLPENEWLILAREKMQAGEYRLALRALFLATLAHLGEKQLIAITRTKSNGDYLRELGWRARGRDEVTTNFNEQVRTFDRAWYGWHEVSGADMERFQEQHERITAHAT